MNQLLSIESVVTGVGKRLKKPQFLGLHPTVHNESAVNAAGCLLKVADELLSPANRDTSVCLSQPKSLSCPRL